MDDENAYMNHLASFGRNGDTMLAHINEDEAALLESMGGSGTTNPDTGLPEFFWSELGAFLGDIPIVGPILGGIGSAIGGIGDAVGGLFGGGGDAVSGFGGGAWDAGAGTDFASAAGAGAGAGGALSSATDWLGRNANWLLPAAGLGYAALQGQGNVPYQGQIQQGAQQLSGSAGQLTAPLLSNAPLPSGAQAQLDATAQAQMAAIRSQFANLGLSGSSMEAQALAQVEQQKNANYFNEAMKLATQGFTNIGAANQAYGQLANAVLSRDAAFTNALAAVSGAMGRSLGQQYGTPRTA